MKASVFVGTSVDGFIARRNGDLDFLDARRYELLNGHVIEIKKMLTSLIHKLTADD